MERRRCHRTRTPGRQLEFLAPIPPSAQHTTPAWSSLPLPTRHALTALVTRLLIAHTNGAASASGSDADDL